MIWGVLLIILSLLLSLVRENSFLIINGVISGAGSYKANTAPPEWLITNFSPEQLLLLKWPLTGFFCGAFIFLTLITLKITFNNKLLIKWTIYFYVFMISLGCIILIGGYLTESSKLVFRQVHKIFYMIQSPLVLLVTYTISFAYFELKKQGQNSM